MIQSVTKHRNADYKVGQFVLCVFALGWITCLLFAGGFTTSIQAGMAFLDWPLSNGSINPEGWLTESDKLAEHSHRLLGMKIGFLSIALMVWTFFFEERKGVRTIARTLLLVVVLQGVMGGARVRFDQLNIMSDHNLLAQSFAVAHACGAQIVLGLLVTLTIMSSRFWIERNAGLDQTVPPSIQFWGKIATISIFIQILMGAIMRHAGAGLAIAQFPQARPGSLVPAYWDFGIGIHFAHRVGAIAVTILLMIFLSKLWAHSSTRKALGFGAVLVIALLTIQIYLGALTIWTVKNPHVATAHMLVGAFLLASTYGLTLLAHRSAVIKHHTSDSFKAGAPTTQSATT